MDRVKILEREILFHKNRYYNLSMPVITDIEYDALEEELRRLAPDSPILKITGCPLSPSSWEKVDHSFHVGSLSKAKTLDELKAWALSFPSGTLFQVSQKLDGLTLVVYVHNGYPVKAVTRGNGKRGEDILLNFQKMQGSFPFLHLDSPVFEEKPDCILRGEVTLSHNQFNKHFEGYVSPRNAASGSARELVGSKASLLSVSFYEVRKLDGSSPLSRQQMMDLLRTSGVKVAPNYGAMTLDTLLTRYPEFEQSRSTLGYDIDGLVIWADVEAAEERYGFHGDDTPKAAIALKFPDLEKPAEIGNIRWDLGLGGRLTPVAEFKEPVLLAGASVANVSLHNLDQVLRHQVTVGATVGVVRSGEVIPYLTRVISPGETFWSSPPGEWASTPGGIVEDLRFSEVKDKVHLPSIRYPSTCPECGAPTELQDAYVYCFYQACPGVKRGRILKWIQTLGLKQIGEGLISELVRQGKLEDPADLYKLSCEDVEGVERKGAKHWEKVREALTSRMEVSFVEFMAALGIPNVGSRVWEGIQASGIRTLEDLKWTSLADLEKASGIGIKRAADIYNEIAVLWPLIQKLQTVGVRIKEPIKSGKLLGKTFCITGSVNLVLSGKKASKKDLGEVLEAQGAQMVDGVTKNLSYLIMDDPQSTSSKAEKARKYGTKVITPEEALTLAS